jgi:hypothetical protein
MVSTVSFVISPVIGLFVTVIPEKLASRRGCHGRAACCLIEPVTFQRPRQAAVRQCLRLY